MNWTKKQQAIKKLIEEKKEKERDIEYLKSMKELKIKVLR